MRWQQSSHKCFSHLAVQVTEGVKEWCDKWKYKCWERTARQKCSKCLNSVCFLCLSPALSRNACSLCTAWSSVFQQGGPPRLYDNDGSIVQHINIPGKQPRCCCKNKNKKWSKGTVCCLSFHLDNKNTPVRCVDEMLMPLYCNPTGKLVSSMFTMWAGQNCTASNTLTPFLFFFIFLVLYKCVWANWVFFMDKYIYITTALRAVTMVILLLKRCDIRYCIFF